MRLNIKSLEKGGSDSVEFILPAPRPSLLLTGVETEVNPKREMPCAGGIQPIRIQTLRLFALGPFPLNSHCILSSPCLTPTSSWRLFGVASAFLIGGQVRLLGAALMHPAVAFRHLLCSGTLIRFTWCSCPLSVC